MNKIKPETKSANEAIVKKQPSQKLDYFHGELAEDAQFVGDWDIPYVESSDIVPDKLIIFSKCISSGDYDCWVVFYQDDKSFERLWNNPYKYLPILKKYAGVVCPDFSLYGDYPLSIQLFNVYRSRVIGHWLKQNGIKVIPNVRWSTKYTYSFCFDGLKKNDILFVGSHGCSKKKEDRKAFEDGLIEMVNRLEPRTICVYGKTNRPIFQTIMDKGITVVPFESEFSLTHEVQ